MLQWLQADVKLKGLIAQIHFKSKNPDLHFGSLMGGSHLRDWVSNNLHFSFGPIRVKVKFLFVYQSMRGKTDKPLLGSCFFNV
jgi:hypothetical protein